MFPYLDDAESEGDENGDSDNEENVSEGHESVAGIFNNQTFGKIT